MRRGFLWAAAPVLVLLLSGCAPSPTRADLVGVWTRKGAGKVIFLPDGRFQARDVPARCVLGMAAKPQGPARINVDGRWRLTAPERKWEFGTFRWNVDIDMGPVPGHLPKGAGWGGDYEHLFGPASFKFSGLEEEDPIDYEKAPPAAHLRVE